MNSPNPIGNILNGPGAVAPLVEQAQRLVALNRALRPLLEGSAVDHCRVAGIRGGILRLQADAPAWAARLRYQTPQLLLKLQEALPRLEVASIRITVAPVEAPQRPLPRRRLTLSEESRIALQQTAAAVSDPALKAALERLARRR